MGSPLGPVLANLFMSFHEANWIKEYGPGNILFYKRYVNDIFCLLNNENKAEHFLEYLNSKHTSIKFTMETEVKNKIPFLDILITSSEKGDFHTSVYRKKTFTGLLLNFNRCLACIHVPLHCLLWCVGDVNSIPVDNILESLNVSMV